MSKKTRLWCVLPLTALLAHASFASDAKPVELVGSETNEATTEEAAPTSPVESALTESMEAPTPVKDSKKTTTVKTSHTRHSSRARAAATDDANTPAVNADSNYHIQAGDVLQVTVWKEDDMDREVLVLPDGTISFPLIGSFSVQDQSPAQVQSTIKQKLRSLIPDASVTVLVKAALGHSVSIIGQVAKPGELVMGHAMSVMQALSQAGGLTPFASESHIIILRKVDGKETSIPFPYDDIAEGENLDKNIQLQPGDVIVVPTAGLF